LLAKKSFICCSCKFRKINFVALLLLLLIRNSLYPRLPPHRHQMILPRAVETGGPTHFGPAHLGFGLNRTGLNSPGKKWAEK
jgi:hypothetical protein